MKRNGVYKLEDLIFKCATCKHYNPVIKKNIQARGNCSIRHYKKGGNVYKQRTETCKKYEVAE